MRLILLALFFSLSAFSKTDSNPPHLELDMDGFEYSKILDNSPEIFKSITVTEDELQEILLLGKRNLEWNTKINSKRPSNPLELSTAESQVGVPIENPRQNNRKIIHDTFGELKKTLPSEFIKVILGAGALPESPSVTDEEYLKSARLFDRLYQAASRWLLQEPYMAIYRGRTTMDIRGYYFLQKEVDLEKNLKEFEKIPSDKKVQYKEWLVGLCHNSRKQKSGCLNELENKLSENNALGFYNKYFPNGKSMYESFFELQNPRRDSKWLSSSTLAVAFQEPQSVEVRNWLVDNVQDEWRYNEWKLLLDFNLAGGSSPRVVFKPGATPNVNGLGGSTITMDANRNIQEYNVRWTIRHEFGHVLGFPDCYIEFFDEEKDVMINYQIDTTNLMCSRRGHLQEKHVLQMKKHYN